MKLITYPKYQEDRTGSLVIKEAKLSPTETKITFKSIDSSKENVRIQHTASLIAGDEKYAIQRVEGISTADFEPFSDVTNMEFSLYFEPPNCCYQIVITRCYQSYRFRVILLVACSGQTLF